MPLQNITITSSIKSLATHSYGLKTYIASTDEQSFPIEAITGSYAGAWPSFIPKDLNSTDSASNTTVNLIVNVTQSWDGSNPTIYGYVPYVHNTMEEFINGEFSGSTYIVTNGNLTDDDCEQFLEYNPIGIPYKIFPYSQKYNDVPPPTLIYSYLSAFLNPYTAPSPGQILMFYTDVYSGPGFTTRSTTINYLKINRFDENGNNNTVTLQGLEKIIWIDSSVGLIELDVINRTEYTSYYLFEVSSPVFSNILYFADDNVLDYTFLVTASSTPIILSSSYSSSGTYHYLTSSWDVIYDMNNGFNISSGQYVFSSTPNIDVSFSASMSITLTNPATLSIAINAYDPALPYSIPNAVDSYPAPLLSSINTYGLSFGSTHSIFISGTVPPYPIQNYRYEVDFFITDLSGSGNNLHAYGPLVYAPLPDNRINNWSQFNLITPAQFTYNYWNQWLPYSIPASASDGGNSLWRQRIPNWVSVMYPTSSFVVGTINYPADEYMTSTNDYDELVPFGWISLGHLEPNSQRGLIYAFYNNYTSSIIDPYFSGSTLNNFRSSGSMLAVQVPANTYPPIEFTSSFQMGLSITIPPTFTSSLNGNGLFVDLSYGPPTDTVDIYVNDLDWNPSASNGYLGSLYSGSSGTFFFGPFTGSYIVGSKDSTTIFIVAPSSSRTAYFNEDFSSGDYGYHSHAFLISSMSLYLWPQTASVHNLSFEISQSFFPTQSATSSLIFEPFVYNNFYNTDCDVLMNNYSINDINNILQQVDYDFGSAVPSNIEQIIDGTAQRAQVNDYLYTSNANTRPRYIGTRTTSPNVNLNSVSGGYGVLPNVELTQTYFAYFEKISNIFPILSGKSAAFIKYLVDSDGKTFVPSISSSYYYNLIDNYIAETNAEVSFLEESGVNTTNIITVPIFRAGMYPEPILTSYKKPNINAKTLVFNNNEFNNPSYITTAITVPNVLIAPGDDAVLPFIYPFSYPNDPVLLELNVVDKCFRFSTTSDSLLVPITVTLSAGSNVMFVLEKSLDLLSWETVSQYQDSTPTLTGIFFAPADNPNMFFRIKAVNIGATNLSGPASIYIDVNDRTYPTDIGLSIDSLYIQGGYSRVTNTNNFNIFFDQFGSISSPSVISFWQTGSNSKNVLTSSFFYRVYDEENPFQQRNYIGRSYNITKPFTLKPFDLVSFGNTNESYIIKNIIKNNITNQGLINTDFSTWYTSSNTGWSYNTNEETLYSSGSFPAYATKSFTTNPAASSVLLVSFKVKDWTPKLNNDGSPIIGIGIDTAPTTAGTMTSPPWYPAWYGQSQGSFIPICRNNEHYLLVKVPSSPPVSPSNKYYMSIGTMNYNNLNAPFFDGGIYDLKVQLYNEASCSLYVQLDKNVQSGADLDKFLISRLIENPNYILLDDSLNTNDGFILPQDISPDLKQNYDELAINLQKEGLI